MNRARAGNNLVLDDITERYELGPEIGHGGMGVVHRARDLRVGRDVAIKIMRQDLADSTTVRQRFSDEAVAAARLHSRHAVLVFDAGERESRPFVVMELLSGRSLADELRDGPLEPERVRRFALEALDALEEAHGAGIVHRDVKPGNMLLTHDDHVKVADFGIAKIAEQPDLTLTGEVLGTAAYLAPERLAGETATPASDLYSLGVVMYEALTGRRPFVGTSPVELARAIEANHAARVRDLRPETEPELANVVERALRKRPQDRFADATEMAAALQRDEDEFDLPTEPLESDALPTVAMPSVPAPCRDRVQRIPTPAFAAIAIVVVAAAGLLAATQLEGESTPPPAEAETTEPTLPPAVEDALSELDAVIGQ